MTADQLRAAAAVDRPTLELWIAKGWIIPDAREDHELFSEVDLARCHLVADLAGPLQVNAEGIDIILDLIDQLYGVRHAMRALVNTAADEPDAVPSRVVLTAERE